VCYFSSISVSFKIIEDRFGAKFVQSESFKPVFSASAFTCPDLPVISEEDPEHIVLMQWGLIPFWAKDKKSALSIREKTLNARAETLSEKPSFRHCISAKRCLVLADGFFEWRHINSKTYPYYIRLASHEPFAFAGIWDKWKNPESQESIKTFSIITTKANSLMEKIHNTKKRMPVILPREKERVWLGDQLERDQIQSLLQPYEASGMEAYPVSKIINKLGFNTMNPEVTNRQEYNELEGIE
jgi:putative SOS response-associated peptidase YedK